MDPIRNTEGYPTPEEIYRPLTDEERLAFETLDSPLGALLTREYRSMDAGVDGTQAAQARIDLLYEFHDRVEVLSGQPNEIAACRVVHEMLTEWFKEVRHLTLDERAGLYNLMLEARNAYTGRYLEETFSHD